MLRFELIHVSKLVSWQIQMGHIVRQPLLGQLPWSQVMWSRPLNSFGLQWPDLNIYGTRLSCSNTSILQWRHNENNGVPSHWPLDCFPSRLFRRRSKKTSKLRITGFYESTGHWWIPHKGPVTRKVSSLDDIIMNDHQCDILYCFL